MIYRVFVAVFLMTAVLSCQQKSESTIAIESNLDQLLDSIYENHPNGVGFILHVEAPDKNVSWTGAVGYSNRETREMLQPDQPGNIGSISKTFISAAIFRLIEMDSLRLDQPIDTWIPERTSKLLIEYEHPINEITLAHLLSHRSGIPHNGTETWFEREENNPKYRWSRDELIRDAISNLDRGEVGEFNYSDVNYYLLTEIIEEVTETSFYLAIRELLKFEELGLNQIWFYTLEPYPDGVKPLFYQYKESRNWISTFDESPTWGMWAGAITSTAADLAKFCHALANGNVFDKPETLELMFSSLGQVNSADGVGFSSTEKQYASQYRMGITYIDGPGFTAFGHDGYWGSLLYHFPKKNISFAFFGLNSDELLDFDKLFLDIIESVNR